MVLAGISYNGSLNLYVIMKDSLTSGFCYKDNIDTPVIVRPYACAIGEDFILNDDNASHNHVTVVNQASGS